MRNKRLKFFLNYYRFIIKISHLITVPLWIVMILLIVCGQALFGIILGIVGTIIVAVHNNYDIFALSETKADYETLHQKFLGELR